MRQKTSTYKYPTRNQIVVVLMLDDDDFASQRKIRWRPRHRHRAYRSTGKTTQQALFIQVSNNVTL